MSTTKTSSHKTTQPATKAIAGEKQPGKTRYLLNGGLSVIVTVLIAAAVLLIDYVVAIYTAVSIVPNIAAMIQQATGVTTGMSFDVVVAGWLLPVIFLTALIFAAEVFLMRALWRASRRVNTSLKRRFGLNLNALG
jgi:hypothetical protein